MKIKLLENGLDSLKKGFEHLKNYEEIRFLDKKNNERYFVLKDAILAIHHGLEILFKTVLLKTNEVFVFSEINKELKDAFQRRRVQKLASLFEASSNLYTVSYTEAIDRVQKLCGFEVDPKFRLKLDKIQEYRNQITHSEVILDEFAVNNSLEGLVDHIDIFFLSAIGKSYSTITGYSEFKRSYKEYEVSHGDAQKSVKQKAIEAYLSAFERQSISMGTKEVKIITDINAASGLLKILFKSDLRFGTDIYNGYCSGEVSEFKRIGNDRFSMFTKDNRAKYIFKFKSLMLYMPPIDDDFSPIMFFEADQDSVDDENRDFIRNDSYQRQTLSGIHFVDEKRDEWNPAQLNEFYSKMEYDEYFVTPRHYHVERFLSPGIFCFVNIQMLNYGNMERLISDFKGKSLNELAIAFRQMLSRKRK